MSIAFRIVLIVFALLAMVVVLRRISQNKLLMDDAVFWFGFSFFIVLLAVFPQIAFFLSSLLGIASPANLVFLVVIAILVLYALKSSIRLSELNSKITDLVQEQALQATEERAAAAAAAADQTAAAEAAEQAAAVADQTADRAEAQARDAQAD